MALAVLCAVLTVGRIHASEVDAAKTIVFGPGLRPDVVVPTRHFFVQAVGEDVNNFSMSVGDVFKVELRSLTGVHVSSYLRIYNLRNGVYLCRYRLLRCARDGLSISVLLHGSHVQGSPFQLPGPVHDESCYCPRSADLWKKTMNCPSEEDQIRLNFEPFPSIKLASVRRYAEGLFPKESRGASACHYTIKKNKLYRRCLGFYVDFKMFSDSILLSLLSKVRIPDVEFFFNLGDWPHVRRRPDAQPIISWCGSTSTLDIILPTYETTSHIIESMSRRSTDYIVAGVSPEVPSWSDKLDQAVFRGRDSSQSRLELARLSLKHPDLLDAGITRFFFFPVEPNITKESIIFNDFFKYKYVISMDGTVAAYRFLSLLHGDSLVLKEDSEYYEHFYHGLQPYKHFVPFKKDLSDLLEKLAWVKSNKDKVHEIIKNAQNYVREHVTPERVYCFIQRVLEEYASRQVGSPEIHPEMELVSNPEPTVHGPVCPCSETIINSRDEL